MNISFTNLIRSDAGFHGIVLEKSEMPLGKILLDVLFRINENFGREKLEFEIVDWPSQYHTY
jgi:hypothetical protein